MSYDNKVAVEEQWQYTYENPALARRVIGVDGSGSPWGAVNPMPVNISSITPDTPLRQYGTALAVAYSVETTLITYTVPLNTALIISGLNFGGEADGKFIVYVDGTEIMRTYNNPAERSMYLTINDNNLYILQGQVVDIKVTNISHRQNASDYQATLIGATLPDSSLPPSTLLTGLVSYYPLDETTGTTANDVASVYNGVISGSPTLGATGKIGTSYDFTFTSGQGVTITNPLTGLTTYTMSCWFNTSAPIITDARPLLFANGSNNGATGAGPAFKLGEAGKLNILIHGFGWGSPSVSTYNDGVWHLAVFTKNGNDYNLYIDGGATAVSTLTTASGSFGIFSFIGSRHTGVEGFEGKIDETGMWNRVLTAIEMTELYNAGVGKTYPFT